MKRAFLIRHGHVDKINKQFDTLNDNGVEFSCNIEKILKDYGTKISHAFYENEDGERCRNTIEKLSCKKSAFGDRANFRNINEVLKNGIDDFVVCYRAPNIECGALYHVINFDLHTKFSDKNYLSKVREKMKLGYKYIYVLTEDDGKWGQVDSIPTGYDYYGKLPNH